MGTPEQAEKKVLTPAELLLKDLNEHFDSTVLKPGGTIDLPPLDNPGQAMGTCIEQVGDAEQDLRAVIKTGNDFLFVVDTDVRLGQIYGFAAENTHSTVLSRYYPGHRAEIVGLATKRDLHSVGAEPPNHFDQDVVRPGAFIRFEKTDDNIVKITDRGSINPIEIFTKKIPTEQDNEKTQTPKQPDTLSPITNGLWSVEPNDLKAVVRSSFRR